MARNQSIFSAHSVGYAANMVLLCAISWGVLYATSDHSSAVLVSALCETIIPLGFSGSFIGCGLLFPRLHHRLGKVVMLMSLCLSIGYLVFFGDLYLPKSLAPALLAGAAALISFGSALSLCLWQRVFFSETIIDTGKHLIVGIALMAFVWIGITTLKGVFSMGIAIAASIIVNHQCLSRLANTPSDRSPSRAVTKNSRNLKRLISSSWRYATCAGIIGMISKLARSLVPAGESAFAFEQVLAIAILLAAIALFLFWETWDTGFPLSRSYAICALAATALSCLVLFGDALSEFLAGALFLLFFLLSTLMLMSTVEIAREQNLDPSLVCGLFCGCVYLITDFGSAGLLLSFPNPLIIRSSILAGAVVSVVLCMPWLSRHRSSAKCDHQKRQNRPLPDTNRHSSLPQETSNCEQTRPENHENMVRERCLALKRKYGLTERETDVLEMIARGHSLRRTAELMFVSENTVRTHRRSLYRKLDVHRKQEIIDLIESPAPEAPPV